MSAMRSLGALALAFSLGLGGCHGRSAPGAQSLTPFVTAVPPVPSGTPVPTDQVRPAAFAGTWYPGDPTALASTTDGLLAAAEPVDGAPIALVVPHAGFTYSGAVAAAGFRQIQGGAYDVAVIIGADHQPPLARPVSVWAEGALATPLGQVPVDTELTKALLAADSRFTFDRAAWEGEHAVEIELPFLQRACPACRVVPVLMGADDDATVQALATALAGLLPGRRAVVIASSDLSHYPSYTDAQTVDGETLAAMETGDPAAVRAALAAALSKGTPNLATAACSQGPILAALTVARRLGGDTVTVLRSANSGDVAGADKQQVVGYGAVMFWHYTPPALSPPQRTALLALARQAIATRLQVGQATATPPADPALARRSAAFVTLRIGGELRGCIGRIRADLPLYRAVEEMAVASAVDDPRFPTLTAGELAQTQIEISVLSPMRRVTDPAQVQVGVDGLAIYSRLGQGLLLPQVAVDEGWDRNAFLQGLCEKAGLAAGCWREGSRLYSFSAIVFGE